MQVRLRCLSKVQVVEAALFLFLVQSCKVFLFVDRTSRGRAPYASRSFLSITTEGSYHTGVPFLVGSQKEFLAQQLRASSRTIGGLVFCAVKALFAPLEQVENMTARDG